MSCANWTPPPTGSACWFEVPALDVQRAKAFYAKVWGWTFKPNPPDSTHYTDDGLAMFSCPDGKLMGGIKKVEDEVDIKKTKGGTMVYLWADSIEDQGEKIKEAGGKVVGERYPESDQGMIQEFEDTEGNLGGMYAMVKS